MTRYLCFTSARELAASIRRRSISAREVMAAFLGQIARLNPKINAIVAKLPDEECLALADEADRQIVRGDRCRAAAWLAFRFQRTRPGRWFSDDARVVDLQRFHAR